MVQYSREALGLPAEYLLLGAFNRPNKVDPDTFATWVAILQAVPNTALWMIGSESGTMMAALTGECHDRP